MKFDNVTRPAHYNQGEFECIDAMRQICSEDEFRTHCRLTAFKYLWRAGDKGDELENYRKAIWYLRFACGDDPRDYKTQEQETPPEWQETPPKWLAGNPGIRLKDILRQNVVYWDEDGIIPEGKTVIVEHRHDLAMATHVLELISGRRYKTTCRVNMNYYLGGGNDGREG